MQSGFGGAPSLETEEYGPPRMSQEINPQNLAELFADVPASEPKPVPAPLTDRATAFAGSAINDEFEMKKLQVFVRVRPTATDNAAVNAASKWEAENCVHASTKHTLAIAPPEGSMAYRSGDRGQTFTFSQVFDATTTQEDYYAGTAAPLVADFLSNPKHNSVMMAYGITAAGKTYTIEGTKSRPGVLPRALSYILQDLHDPSLAIRVSYCEIYNEAVYDLLEDFSNPQKSRHPLRLMEDSHGRVTVNGLSEVEVGSVDKALTVLKRGAKHRQRAETGLNYSSSRSHSIFTIQLVRTSIDQKHEEQPQISNLDDRGESQADAEHHGRKSSISVVTDKKAVKVERLGRIAFVDLAGSERAQRTGNVGIRLKESVAINSSLMTLGRCLEALRWNQQQQALIRAGGGNGVTLKVVPYRESKVTHLFRDALHGYGTVILSVNVSPCARDYDETAHVLRYASLATAIGTLQQVDAPRRAIKAITPGALRRAKRKAAAKAAQEEAAKRARKAAQQAEEAAAAALAAAAAAQAAVKAMTQAAAQEIEPSVYPIINNIADDEKAEEEDNNDYDEVPRTVSIEHHREEDDEKEEEEVGKMEEEEVKEEDEGYVFSPEFAPRPSFVCLDDDLIENIDLNRIPYVPTPHDSLLSPVCNPDCDGTPSTPCCSDGEEQEEYMVDGDDEAVGALQAQIQQLIRDLQAAEERAVLIEGEVREEVAAEMAGLLKDMEESYRERLVAEVAAAEARAKSGKGGGKNKKKNNDEMMDENESRKQQECDKNTIATLEKKLCDAKVKEAKLVERLSELEMENATLKKELQLQQVEAKEQSERLENAKLALETAQARAESLAIAMNETRRNSEEQAADRLREQVLQLRANADMELEMSEQQVERLRKENQSLRNQLAAAMVTLETVASPSMPVMQRMVASCPPGGFCGPVGTPHDIALARARQAAAAEEHAQIELRSDDGKNGNKSATQKSRFAEEAENEAFAIPALEPTDQPTPTVWAAMSGARDHHGYEEEEKKEDGEKCPDASLYLNPDGNGAGVDEGDVVVTMKIEHQEMHNPNVQEMDKATTNPTTKKDKRNKKKTKLVAMIKRDGEAKKRKKEKEKALSTTEQIVGESHEPVDALRCDDFDLFDDDGLTPHRPESSRGGLCNTRRFGPLIVDSSPEAEEAEKEGEEVGLIPHSPHHLNNMNTNIAAETEDLPSLFPKPEAATPTSTTGPNCIDSTEVMMMMEDPEVKEGQEHDIVTSQATDGNIIVIDEKDEELEHHQDVVQVGDEDGARGVKQEVDLDATPAADVQRQDTLSESVSVSERHCVDDGDDEPSTDSPTDKEEMRITEKKKKKQDNAQKSETISDLPPYSTLPSIVNEDEKMLSDEPQQPVEESSQATASMRTRRRAATKVISFIESPLTEEEEEDEASDARDSEDEHGNKDPDFDVDGVGDEEEEESPEKPRPAPRRKRRLLQNAKPLSKEMRFALGEIAGGELPIGAPLTARKPMLTPGKNMAVALGLSPAPKMTRYQSPRRHQSSCTPL